MTEGLKVLCLRIVIFLNERIVSDLIKKKNDESQFNQSALKLGIES